MGKLNEDLTLVAFAVEKEILKEIDKVAKKQERSRSGYIRNVLSEDLQKNRKVK